jgi:hypothetical protein
MVIQLEMSSQDEKSKDPPQMAVYSIYKSGGLDSHVFTLSKMLEMCFSLTFTPLFIHLPLPLLALKTSIQLSLSRHGIRSKMEIDAQNRRSIGVCIG